MKEIPKDVVPGNFVYLLKNENCSISLSALKITKKISEVTCDGETTKYFVANSSGKEFEFSIPENAELFVDDNDFTIACLNAAAENANKYVQATLSWCHVPVRSALRFSRAR